MEVTDRMRCLALIWIHHTEILWGIRTNNKSRQETTPVIIKKKKRKKKIATSGVYLKSSDSAYLPSREWT